MLPPFRADGWLPEGHHRASWEEIDAVFGGEAGSQRAQVFSRLRQWREAARAAGLGGLLILDGSFISQKADPGDFDAIFVYDEPAAARLAQSADARDLISYSRCKERFAADIFTYSATSVRDFPAFCRTDGFDRDQRTQEPKGVVEVPL